MFVFDKLLIYLILYWSSVGLLNHPKRYWSIYLSNKKQNIVKSKLNLRENERSRRRRGGYRTFCWFNRPRREDSSKKASNSTKNWGCKKVCITHTFEWCDSSLVTSVLVTLLEYNVLVLQYNLNHTKANVVCITCRYEIGNRNHWLKSMDVHRNKPLYCLNFQSVPLMIAIVNFSQRGKWWGSNFQETKWFWERLVQE